MLSWCCMIMFEIFYGRGDKDPKNSWTNTLSSLDHFLSLQTTQSCAFGQLQKLLMSITIQKMLVFTHQGKSLEKGCIIYWVLLLLLLLHYVSECIGDITPEHVIVNHLEKKLNQSSQNNVLQQLEAKDQTHDGMECKIGT